MTQHIPPTLEWPLKGLAPTTAGRALADILERRPSLFDGDFSAPVMTIRRSAIDHNVETMARYCRELGVDLAPHGKTTMAPRIFERQLAAGAWAITVANPAQLAVCRSVGVPRVLLANELVDRSTVDWVRAQLAADPGFDFLCYVDSVEGVELLARATATAAGTAATNPATASPAATVTAPGPGLARTLDVLIEVGFAGGRTGCRTIDQVVAVAQAAAASHSVRVVGVAGFEGGIGSQLTPEVFAAVDAFLEFIHAAASELVARDLVVDRGGGVIVSAGGSVFFDRVPPILTRPLPKAAQSHCILRSGCYVSHDSGFYERMSPFTREGAAGGYSLRPALEVWAEVFSAPEPGLALVGIGRRDVPFDLGLPVPITLRRAPGASAEVSMEDASACSVRALNDQHAFVELATGIEVRPGDWLSFGISHPCTAFDKWRLIAEIDDDYRVVDFVETFF